MKLRGILLLICLACLSFLKAQTNGDEKNGSLLFRSYIAGRATETDIVEKGKQCRKKQRCYKVKIRKVRCRLR